MELYKPIKIRITLFIVLVAMFTALTTIATLVLQIPFPGTGGYFNLGDAFVMISGFLLGPIGGFIAGGVGSAFADAIGGWFAFVPVTFVAKGLEGMMVGFFSHRTKPDKTLSGWDIIALLIGSLAMLSGYYFLEVFYLQILPEQAFLEMVTINLVQVVSGSIATIIAGPIVRKYMRTSIYQEGLD